MEQVVFSLSQPFLFKTSLRGDRVCRLVKHLVIRGVKPKDIFMRAPLGTHSRITSPCPWFAASGPQNKGGNTCRRNRFQGSLS